jgi:hypothetical protein
LATPKSATWKKPLGWYDMKVKLFGNLRQKAGANELVASGATIREALESLCADNEPLRTAIFAGAAYGRTSG